MTWDLVILLQEPAARLGGRVLSAEPPGTWVPRRTALEGSLGGGCVFDTEDKSVGTSWGLLWRTGWFFTSRKMSRAERGTRILAIALFLLASHGADAVPGQCCTGQGVCAVPTTAIQMMACEGGYATEFEALAQNPPWDWYLRQPRALGEPGFCTNNNYLECTTDPDCAGGACVAAQSTAKDFVKNYMSCCRQCIWDMQFPDADPIQVAESPLFVHITVNRRCQSIVVFHFACPTNRGYDRRFH
jgi:hypothetical protein